MEDDLEDKISEGPSDIRPSCYIGVKNDPTCFKILSLNAQSINNKFQAIRDVTNDTKATILAVQETWGRNATTDYSIAGFHRPEFVTRRGEGMNLGGVAIWIQNDHDYEVLDTNTHRQNMPNPSHLPTIQECNYYQCVSPLR